MIAMPRSFWPTSVVRGDALPFAIPDDTNQLAFESERIGAMATCAVLVGASRSFIIAEIGPVVLSLRMGWSGAVSTSWIVAPFTMTWLNQFNGV